LHASRLPKESSIEFSNTLLGYIPYIVNNNIYGPVQNHGIHFDSTSSSSNIIITSNNINNHEETGIYSVGPVKNTYITNNYFISNLLADGKDS